MYNYGWLVAPLRSGKLKKKTEKKNFPGLITILLLAELARVAKEIISAVSG